MISAVTAALHRSGSAAGAEMSKNAACHPPGTNNRRTGGGRWTNASFCRANRHFSLDGIGDEALLMGLVMELF
jgi:hypothetical protein